MKTYASIFNKFTVVSINLDEIDINPTLNSIAFEIGSIVNAHEFINYEPGFDLNNPCVPIKEEIISMLDEEDDATDNEPIEEVDIMQIGDVVVDKVGFKNAKNASVTLHIFWKKDLLMLHLPSRAFKHFKKK
jgi:hypothetical protein